MKLNNNKRNNNKRELLKVRATSEVENTIEINKVSSWFFKNTHKIYETLARLKDQREAKR